MLRPFPLVLTAALAAGCVDPLALGQSEVDATRLADSDNLAHLAAALDDGELTVQELLERGESLTVSSAPDPTQPLLDTAALDDDRPTTGGVPLRVMTQNVALLDANIFWFIDYAQTPLLDERRDELPGVFLDAEPDILFLQEVWLGEDVDRFAAAAEERGYEAVTGSRQGYNDGLMLLIRSTLLEEGSEVESGLQAYQVQDGLEEFPGPGIKRGYQWARFTHPQLGPIVVFNTHMQAFPAMWLNRLKQARELGIAIEREATGGELVLVGGDLNAGPYYRDAKWESPDGTVEDSWWSNAFSYPMLLEYGGLTDLAVMGRPLEDAASDVTLGDTVVNDAALALEIPGAREGFCEETPHTTFTASDCNTLYFQQYGGTEYPARLDHLHVRDPEGRVRVLSTELRFTEVSSFDGVETEPSDHYGVSVDLMIDGG